MGLTLCDGRFYSERIVSVRLWLGGVSRTAKTAFLAEGVATTFQITVFSPSTCPRPADIKQSPNLTSSAGHVVGSRLVGRHFCGAPPRTSRWALGAVKHAVLELPLSENEVLASQRTLDHLAQSAQGFALANFFLRREFDKVRRGRWEEKGSANEGGKCAAVCAHTPVA